MYNPFTPSGTISISGSVATASGRLTSPNPVSVRIFNSGAVPIFFKVGKSDVTAAITDTPLAALATEVFNLTPSGGSHEVTHIAVITGSSTATVYVTVGQGGS